MTILSCSDGGSMWARLRLGASCAELL